MKMLTILAVTGITLECGLAQEPFTYKPDDIPKHEIPEGLTAEEYIQKIYQERHYKIKITFRAVDEDGNPVPGADADVGIDSLLHADGHNNYKGKTDAKGLFTVESRGQGSSDVVIEKDGYYPSRPKVRWSGKLNNDRELAKKVGFRPWNPTIDVVLKKIGKPIPMIVRPNHQVGGIAPKMKEWLGVDLFVGDWVKPHGKGKISDMLILLEEAYTDERRYKVSAQIKFPKDGDGLIRISALEGKESLLKFPRIAPEKNYINEVNVSIESDDTGLSKKSSLGEGAGYFFRIRTNKDKQGNIISAHYGKIVKNFKLNIVSRKFSSDPNFREASIFYMSYYLNPNNNDANLEFDMKNNLAPEAKWKDYPYP